MVAVSWDKAYTPKWFRWDRHLSFLWSVSVFSMVKCIGSSRCQASYSHTESERSHMLHTQANWRFTLTLRMQKFKGKKEEGLEHRRFNIILPALKEWSSWFWGGWDPVTKDTTLIKFMVTTQSNNVFIQISISNECFTWRKPELLRVHPLWGWILSSLQAQLPMRLEVCQTQAASIVKGMVGWETTLYFRNPFTWLPLFHGIMQSISLLLYEIIAMANFPFFVLMWNSNCWIWYLN